MTVPGIRSSSQEALRLDIAGHRAGLKGSMRMHALTSQIVLYLIAQESLRCILQDQLQNTAPEQPQAFLVGTAVNQDGRSSSLTAPNGPAQQAVIIAAMAASGTSPSHMALLQMHGTGTPLGDPIEIGAATAVLESSRQADDLPWVLAAGKTSFGHQEPAAGECLVNATRTSCLDALLVPAGGSEDAKQSKPEQRVL